jgi:hypothetical protein
LTEELKLAVTSDSASLPEPVVVIERNVDFQFKVLFEFAEVETFDAALGLGLKLLHNFTGDKGNEIWRKIVMEREIDCDWVTRLINQYTYPGR